jgi:hypothetical protein
MDLAPTKKFNRSAHQSNKTSKSGPNVPNQTTTSYKGSLLASTIACAIAHPLDTLRTLKIYTELSEKSKLDL